MVKTIAWASCAAMLFAASSLSPAYGAASRNCTVSERNNADQQLHLTDAQKKSAIEAELPWGAPVHQTPAGSEVLLVQRDYVNLYDTNLRVPIWSAEKLDPTRIGKVSQRINCFRADPRLTADQASAPSDYVEPVYDQGHLTPDADQDSAIPAELNTYLMSNMAPENCQFNRGIWQILEGLTRMWARQGGAVYVITGSVFDRDKDGKRDPDDQARRMKSNNGRSRVAVPSAMYRIVARQSPDGAISTIAILLPQTTDNPDGDDAIRYLQDHVVTIDQLEEVTGLRYFPARPALKQSAALWMFTGKVPHTLCHEQPEEQPW